MATPSTYSGLTAILIGAVLLVRALWVVFVPVTTPSPSSTSVQSLFTERLALAAVALTVGVLLLLVQRGRRAAT
jgi:hypothetical protein